MAVPTVKGVLVPALAPGQALIAPVSQAAVPCQSLRLQPPGEWVLLALLVRLEPQ